MKLNNLMRNGKELQSPIKKKGSKRKSVRESHSWPMGVIDVKERGIVRVNHLIIKSKSILNI
jgi:hypothetical protein